MTVDDVKEILNIAAEDDTFDDQIDALLDDSIDGLESEVNFEFELDEEDDKIVPAGLKRVVAFDILQLLRGGAATTDVSSIKLGDYSVSYSAGGISAGSLTPAIRDRIVRNYRRAGVW